jgi:hypothetical protein
MAGGISLAEGVFHARSWDNGPQGIFNGVDPLSND